MKFVAREKRTGELLRMARVARGLSAVDVSRLASVGDATYFRWEHSHIVPNTSKRNRLCLLLGLPMGALDGSDVALARREGRKPVPRKKRKKKRKRYEKPTGNPVGRPVPPPKQYLSRRKLARLEKLNALRNDGSQENISA
jgi:transcriptional regulator with XRE-family HTH domain